MEGVENKNAAIQLCAACLNFLVYSFPAVILTVFFFSLFRCFVTDYNLIPPAFFICGTFGVSPGRQVLWVMSAESCASWALPWQIRKNSNKNQGTLEKSAEK